MKHCLIVDDSAVIRKVARRILEGFDLAVTDVEDAEQALAAYRERLPDLVIVDAVMPNGDGFDLVRDLRGMPDGGRPKIVVSIIENDVATVARVFHVGGDAYLTKPFTTDILRGKLEEVDILPPSGSADAA
ncbi:response regulator [Enterovirga rhinocerotis]|uniref:Response regulator receiver protein n=1 Tax=Enterovirga rhinocerotis TaxID=1339210 RepID=A0A4R7C4U0_9HYPH|nr:response regulator [Enterovirga rhinocerotis]TDR93408.1 response regulator receiver protein [Enterovirga rhinocerotis]